MSLFINDFSIADIEYFDHYFLDEHHNFTGHRHDCWEMNIVLQGKIQVTYDDTIFTLHQNEVFIGHPNVFHRNQMIDNHTVEMIVIHFTTNDLPILFSPQVFSLNTENLFLFHVALSDLERFKHDNTITTPVLEQIPYSFKKLLEVFISRILTERIHIPFTTQHDTLIYNQAVTYMKNNLDKNCSIAELATHCCVCSTSLKRIFKKYTGQGVITFFIELKLETSKFYLQKNYSVAEVSHLLGFTSQAYFSKVFKKTYGYPPTNYKKSLE